LLGERRSDSDRAVASLDEVLAGKGVRSKQIDDEMVHLWAHGLEKVEDERVTVDGREV
jgi:hypothetical protein